MPNQTFPPHTLSLSLLSLLAALAACRAPAPPPRKPPPPTDEAALGQVKLSPEAEARLGIPAGLRPLENRRAPARRLLPGEVQPAPGGSALVVAPQPGVVTPLPGLALPLPGAQVQAGQPLLGLAPQLQATERVQVQSALVDAEAQVQRAQVQSEAAALALTRAEQLVADQVAGARVLDEARAQADTARAALTAARAQRDGLAGRGGPLGLLRVIAPLSGLVRELRVAPRQLVPAGAVLLEIVADDPLWVRVPVPTAALSALRPDEPALVASLDPDDPAPGLLAPPVRPPPPTAQPQLGTVDLYFQLSGLGRPRPGARVAVHVAERADTVAAQAPAAALVVDGGGGTFVYKSLGQQRFQRRRVDVLRREGDAVLLLARSLGDGLAVGDPLVTAGAIELFGVEFGVSK